MVTTQITIDRALATKLSRLAKAQKTTIDDLVREILAAYLSLVEED